MKIVKALVIAAALIVAGCASAAPPATCVISGTVLDGGAVAVPNTPVRFRTIAPTLSGTSGIATQDLTTKTATDGTWALTLIQGLNAQVDIPAVGIYADTVIPSGASCPAAFSSLTLSARGALTPATILSTTGPSMGGDLTGSSPNPSVVGLRSVPLHADTATDGKVWVYRTASGDYRLESFPVTAAVQTVTAGQGVAVTGTATNPVVAVANGGIVAAMLGSGAASSNVGGLGGDLSGSLPSPQIGAGAIVNADVNASAAIAWTKIDKTGATGADVGALEAGSVIAAINASSESPKIANAQLVDIAQAKVTGLVADLAAKRNTADAIPQADVTGLVAALAAKEATANKGAVSGYAGLDSGGKVPAAQLPSTVLADGDKGDITVSASGTAFAIDAKAVTYSKLQDISAPDRILGAVTAGSAAEIPFTAAARALADDADAPAMRTTLGLGTASTRDVAAAGDATSSEVVKGDDTRLTNARAPSAHTHAEADVTGLTTDLAAKVPATRTVSATAPLTGGGALSGDLTLAVSDAAAGSKGVVQMTGDLGGTGAAPTVASVGGQTAANVAAGVVLANAATNANTVSAIVRRDASGNFAAGTITANLTGNVSGTAANITGVAAVANGGTGQATATAGFDALAPSSAKGDLLGHDGATSVRVPVGADGLALVADAASAAGVKWATPASGSVTSVATGNGLQGGPITTTGTVDLRLNASGGLSKILGAGNNELGIAAGGVADAMLATPVVPQARTITTTAPLTIGGGASADLSANRTLAISDATTTTLGAVKLAGDLAGTGLLPTIATVGGQTAANVAAGAVLANAATSANTASAIVRRDASGNFAGGTFTGAVTGNVTGNLTGNVTGNLTGNATGVLRDKGGQVYDVKAYGATGNGSDDDTVAIGSVITAMGAAGGIIYFPPGNYKFSTLTISNPGTILRGAGSGATTLSTTSTGGTAITLAGDGTGIEGFTVDVIGAAVSPQTSILASGKNVTISDLILTDWYKGISVTGNGAQIADVEYASAAAGAACALEILSSYVVAERIGNGQSGTLTITSAVTVSGSFGGGILRSFYFVLGGNSTGLLLTNASASVTGLVVENSTFYGAGTGAALSVVGGVEAAFRNVAFSSGTNAAVTSGTILGLTFDGCSFGLPSNTSNAATGDALLHAASGSITLRDTLVKGGGVGFANLHITGAGSALTWDGGTLAKPDPFQAGAYGVLVDAAAAQPSLVNVAIEDVGLWTVAALDGGVLVGPNVASAASITLVSRITRITGSAAIDTISAPFTSDPIILIPAGAFSLTNAGNIGAVMTATVGVPITLVFDDFDQLWYPSVTLAPISVNGTTATVSGALFAQRSVEAVTTTKSPTASESREVYTNEGDADGAAVTLPTAAAGLEYTGVVQAAQLLTINAAAGDTIRIGANVTGAAGYVRSNVIGSRVTLLAINATEWVATSFAGEWTNGTWWVIDTHAEGAIYFATPAATANGIATPIKCAGTTAAQGTAVKVTQATTNRLTYTGVPTRDFKVEATISLSAAAATNGKIHIYKNGSPITGATIARVLPIADVGAMAIHAYVSLATNDYVELWCETDDGDDITITNGVLSIASIN